MEIAMYRIRNIMLGLAAATAATVWPLAVARAAPCTLTAQDIDAFLTQKGSPMAGHGKTFVEQGSAWNVDPRLILAIAGAETTFGSHVCADNNAWNWFWGGSCSKSPFSSWDAGIATVTKYVRLSKLNQGRTTIAAFQQAPGAYCQSKCENWLPLVTMFYAEVRDGGGLGGDASDLGCAPECAAATCSTFVACATAGASCTAPVCARIAQTGNGQCVEGTTSCAGLKDCTSQSDCPGGVCLADTCCGRNVCVPSAQFCSSNHSGNPLQLDPDHDAPALSPGPTLAAP
jgi:hypothetical protein